ncbi:MAG: alpha/beta hydrolase family protein [Thiotrichales bacterium]
MTRPATALPMRTHPERFDPPGRVGSGLMTRAAWLLLALSGLSACASVHTHNDAFAQQRGYEVVAVPGLGHTHTAYVKAAGEGGRWHVYLEGDGLPWIARFFINPDPTVRKPLLMRLMTSDRAPTLYLGRPCYGGGVEDAACEPWLWTDGRHSAAVVASQIAALRWLGARHGVERIALIGHSGGGALAMLMAAELPEVEAVMTLAGNLNLAEWTGLHHYSPLTGSLDPAQQPPLPARIVQHHYAGGADTNIPPPLTAPVVRRQACARWEVFDAVTHSGGWETQWPVMLARLRAAHPSDCRAARKAPEVAQNLLVTPGLWSYVRWRLSRRFQRG